MDISTGLIWFFINSGFIYNNSWKLYFPTVIFFTIIVIWIAAAYKYGDWRNWKLYYPTILFYCSGNLIYNIVFHDKYLWSFKNPFFSHTLTDFFNTLTVAPSTILIFLFHYPKKVGSQITYVAIWVFAYSIIELFFVLMKGIIYSNGWTFWWSVIHNIYQFILIRIHYKNPLLAWVGAFAILIIIMTIFKVSV